MVHVLARVPPGTPYTIYRPPLCSALRLLFFLNFHDLLWNNRHREESKTDTNQEREHEPHDRNRPMVIYVLLRVGTRARVSPSRDGRSTLRRRHIRARARIHRIQSSGTACADHRARHVCVYVYVCVRERTGDRQYLVVLLQCSSAPSTLAAAAAAAAAAATPFPLGADWVTPVSPPPAEQARSHGPFIPSNDRHQTPKDLLLSHSIPLLKKKNGLTYRQGRGCRPPSDTWLVPIGTGQRDVPEQVHRLARQIMVGAQGKENKARSWAKNGRVSFSSSFSIDPVERLLIVTVLLLSGSILGPVNRRLPSMLETAQFAPSCERGFRPPC